LLWCRWATRSGAGGLLALLQVGYSLCCRWATRSAAGGLLALVQVGYSLWCRWATRSGAGGLLALVLLQRAEELPAVVADEHTEENSV
jgi:hypothetical protein